MAVLDQLKLANATPQRDTTPVGRFRRRLSETLDLQIEIAMADGSGTPLNRTRKRWVKNDTGFKELREFPVRLRRWWWKDDVGTTYLALKHGSRLLEIAPGKKAIKVGSIEDLPGKLSILREAVRAGELDGCAVVLKGTGPGAKKAGKPEGAPSKGTAARA